MRTLLVFLAVLAAGIPIQAAEAPDWVRQNAGHQVPKFSAKVASVVLFHEESLAVQPDGSRVMRLRMAVKILQRSAEPLVAARAYNVKNGKIRSFQAWLVQPSGTAETYAKDRIIDIALSPGSVYDEARMKILECGEAAVGSIFAWEVIEEEKTVFTQVTHDFQRNSPVMTSRFVLTLPPAWEAEAVVFNGEQIEPLVSGAVSTWELRNLSWSDIEPFSPPAAALYPRLAVSWFPPSGSRSGLPSLTSWNAVSRWLSQLVDPPAAVTDPVRMKALQLTADLPSQLAKIRAIASFVQQTNYVDVSLNLTKGGGYTPRAAEETLARNYGDCKDKTTLMRALLHAIGVESYLTTIYAGDRNYVRAEWASPMQFNHAIIAVRVSGDVILPTVVEAPGLDRLLIFDPTDPFTPVGDLPESEQGSYALIVAKDQGVLLKMPNLPPGASRIESSIEAVMDLSGRIEARLEQQYFGQAGKSLTATQRVRGDEEVKRRFESMWSQKLIGVTVGQMETLNQTEENRVLLNVSFAADRFGEVMLDRLIIVRPGTLGSTPEQRFTLQKRTSPVELDAALHQDLVKVKIPAGFKHDPLPAPLTLETPYGTLQAEWSFQNNEVVFRQTLEIRNITAPASDFAQVREFFEKVSGVRFAPVVLTRK